ncbi:MAG: LON peptidase substrate-binding domain-containing protein, partial [Candidatus Eremiobacterales bacterium]
MAENVRESSSIPSELAILPLQEAVLFPNTVMPLAVTKQHGIKLVEDALKNGVPVGVVALKEKDASPP